MKAIRFGSVFGLIVAVFLLSSCTADDVVGILLEETPTPAPVVVEEPQPQEEQPKSLDELKATNPDSVRLGSGQVTLLEFFAYW